RLGVAAGLTVASSLIVDPVGYVDLGTHTHRLVNRHINHLTRVCRFSANQRADGSDERLVASDMVSVPHLWCDRRRVVGPLLFRIIAAAHHLPTESEMHEVICLVVPPRATATERCEEHINQARIQSLQGAPVETEFL